MAYLVVIHGVKTWVRNPAWYNNYSLYLSAVRTIPHNTKMWSNLATEVDKSGNRSESEMLFRHAIDIDPNYTTGYMNLAYLLREGSRTEEAIEVYRKAADLVTIGLSNKKSSIHVSPKNIKVYTALANLLREHTDSLQEAYELTQKAVKNEPQWEESHNMMGNCLLKLGRFSEARDAFKKAVKLKPDYAVGHSNLGNAHQELGEMSEAELHFREALRLDSNHTLTAFRLAKLIIDLPARTLPRLLEADDLLKAVIEEDPNNGNATFCRGLVHYELKNHSLTEELFQQALNITPHHSGALYNLGVLYSELSRYTECVELLLELLDRDPAHLKGRTQLGTCYMLFKDYPSAREAFTHVLEEDPDHKMALQNYGIMLIELKENRDSLEVFTHLAHLFPEEPSFRQQVEVLKRHLEKQRQKAAQGSAV